MTDTQTLESINQSINQSINMFRRSLVTLSNRNSNASSRTVVRDPRKNKTALSQLVKQEQEDEQDEQHLVNQTDSHPLPFSPSQPNQQSIGSSLGSYALAGAGMSLGFILVGAVFGL